MSPKKRALVVLADREKVRVGVLVPRSQTVAYPQSPGSCQRRPEHASCRRQSTQLAPKVRNSTQERRAGRSPSPRLIHSRISISVSDQTDHSLCHEFQTPRIQDEGKQRHFLGCKFAPCSPPTLSSKPVECTTLPTTLLPCLLLLPGFCSCSSFLLETHSFSPTPLSSLDATSSRKSFLIPPGWSHLCALTAHSSPWKSL